MCQRVVLSYLGKYCEHRQALKGCGVFKEDSPEIDPQIRQYINNTIEPDEAVFFGRPL